MKTEIPIWEKSNLTIKEAAVYFGIAMQKLRQLTAKEHWLGHILFQFSQLGDVITEARSF